MPGCRDRSCERAMARGSKRLTAEDQCRDQQTKRATPKGPQRRLHHFERKGAEAAMHCAQYFGDRRRAAGFNDDWSAAGF